MVTVIDFKERLKKDGEKFYVLGVQSGIEMVKSQVSDKFYATAKKAFVPSTFNKVTCQTLIGEKLPGSIEKVNTELYDFTIPETGELITLGHRYEFIPEC